jgi:putative phage-type endonuclease
MSAAERDDVIRLWREERRSYLGASDAPIVLGVSPYRSAFELWLEKTGQAEPQPESPIMRYGKRVEAAIAQEYEDETGRTLQRFHRVIHHRRYPELAANPDRRVVGERGLVQIKTSWTGWTDVPDHVRVQVQHEMGVTGAEWVDVALGTGFAGLKLYTVERNERLIEHMFTVERDWWQRHVVEGIEPERTGRYRDEVRGVDVMVASSAQAAAMTALRDLRDAVARLEAREANIVEWLKASMAGAMRLDGRDYGFSVSWRPTKERETTDWRLVAEAYRRALVESTIESSLPRRVVELDAIESLYTQSKPGMRPFKPHWTDVEPTSEEDS